MYNLNTNDTMGRSNSAPLTSNLDKLADSYLNKAGGEKSVPLDLALLPLFLRDYVQACQLHTDAIPGALITAWLPAVAVNIGNRVFIRGNAKNHYCQIWSVLVGPSSVSRKSTCLRLASRTLRPFLNSLKDLDNQAKMTSELIISNVTNAKMVSLLAANPVRLFEFHEFGTLLKGAAQSYNAGMKENLTSLYDGDDKTICNMERTERIIKPAISIVGASTEGWIYNGFQSAAEQGSGFLQRFIFCLIKSEGKRICSSLDETVLTYADFYNYESVYALFRSIPGSFKLKLSREIRRIWLTEHDRVLNGILDKEDEELLAYATRIYNNVFCALVIMFTLFQHTEGLAKAIETEQCKAFFDALEVSEDTVRQALYLCSYYLENAKPMITIISEGGAWNNERRIIKHLAKKPELTDTHSNIMNKLRIKSKDLNDCMRNLIEQNAVKTESIYSQNARRKTTTYTLLPTARDMYS